MIYYWSKPEPFFIEFGNNYLHGDLLPREADKLPEILFLHGAEGGGRGEFLLLRQVLLEQYGISSCAFDFIGYGSTGGKLLPLHLQERVAQTTDIIDACFDLQAFSIVAADISAETALQLTKSFPIRHLVLLNPVRDYQSARDIPCQIVKIPVEPQQTLPFLNNNPALLAKIAGVIKDTLGGNC
jgi:pimeloyl-ACP methyl ester carboxylesterase